MASFLSNLFGSGATGEAANKNAALLGTYGLAGTNLLDTGLSTGQKTLSDLLAQGRGIISGGEDQAMGVLKNALPEQLQAVQGGIGSLTGLANKYGAGSSMLLDALGVNGPEGTARAQGAFQNAPGFTQGIKSGIDAINQRRAASGMVGSGNADIDALTMAQNAQNQQYGGWLSSLQGMISPELAATQGAANMGTTLANIYGNNANSLAGLISGATNQNLGLTSGVSNADLGLTQGNINDRIALMGNQTSGLMSGNNATAAAETTGAKNLLNAGLGTATMLLSGGTAGFGGSPLAALGSKLFSSRAGA